MNPLPEWSSILLHRIRTDERFPDLDWILPGLTGSSLPAHPVSGLPLHFGSRNCPTPVTRVRWLHAGPDGARFEWIRDRVDPVFHCPNRHTCRFFIPGLTLPEPFSVPFEDASALVPEPILESLENALLQDSEIGYLQCAEADRFTVERVTRGMIGPLWSADSAPALAEAVFVDEPEAVLLHLPIDCTLHEPGPSISDDPLAPLLGEGGQLAPSLARLRARLSYRVLRQRRAVLFGTPKTLLALRGLFPGLDLIAAMTGEI